MRHLTAALLGAAAFMAGAAPLMAQNNAATASATTLAAAEPAVPNTPRQVTPASLAAPQLASPDASKIDASDGKADPGLTTASLQGSDDDDGIVATVNDESISDYELRQRMALFIATSGIQQPKPEDLKRIRAQMLDQLEDEKMELQEAVKKHITVSPAEVDKQINRLLADNNLTIDKLRSVLSNAGASEAALRAQIAASLAWQKAIEDEYSSDINITPAQIDAEMRRQAEGANKTHYLVAEIFLPVDNANQDAKVQKDAQNLESQLQQGASFSELARQFSQSPTAAAGGEIGWVHAGQLATELDTVLTQMKPGAVSEPVRSIGGYYILALHLRQEPLGTKIEAPQSGAVGPAGTLPLARLLLPLGPTPSKEMIENGMKVAAQIRAAYSGCEKLSQMPTQVHGTVFMNLGEMKLSELGPEIQKALADTKPGEMAVPLLSEAGVELIGRCDAPVVVRTAFTLPSREQIQEQLFDEQISAMARRYKRDLRRDADVEVR